MGIFPSGSQTPVWEPAPAKLRFASTARQPQHETEFRGDAYPNRVRVRVAGAISWFPNSRLGTRSSETPFRVPRDSPNAKQSFEEIRTRTEFGYELLERFPGSQTPVWEPALAKLCFASRATASTRSSVSPRMVPTGIIGVREPIGPTTAESHCK